MNLRFRTKYFNLLQKCYFDQKMTGWEYVGKVILIHQLDYFAQKSFSRKSTSDIIFSELFSQLSEEDKILHLNEDEVERIFQLYQAHKISQKAIKAFLLWKKYNWNLQVTHQVSSARKMLELQMKGIRVICIINNQNNLEAEIVPGKNAFQFLIHDLEHAYMFFNDQEQYLAQKVFFQKLSQVIDNPILFNLTKHPECFKQVEYLMSDMNTHWLHGLKFMNHLLHMGEQFQKMNNQFEGNEGQNCDVQEYEFQNNSVSEKWESLGYNMNFPKNVISSFVKINSPGFSQQDFELLNQQFQIKAI